MKPVVVIVIPNRNAAAQLYKGRSMLLQCLESLQATAYPRLRIVVADNQSTDNSREVCGRFENVEFYSVKAKNIPDTNNIGIRHAMRKWKPKYVCMYNTDMILGGDELWLDKLVAFAEGHSRAGLVGCKLLYPTGRIQHAGMLIDHAPRNRGRGEEDRGQYDAVERVEGITAALVLLRTSLIGRIGLFDTLYPNGFDDTDFCIRAGRVCDIYYYGKTSIIHLEGFATANSTDAAQRDRAFAGYQTSYLRYIRKHLRGTAKLKGYAALLARSFITIEDSGHARGHIRIREKPLRHLGMTARAFR